MANNESPRTTELPKGEIHSFQKLWMEWKGKVLNNWSFAKMQPKWLCFEELCFQFSIWLHFWQALPFLVDQCPFGRKQKQTSFYHVYVFFQLSWRRTDFVVLDTEKYSRHPLKRHQTTHGDFSRETSDRFQNLYFLFPISFIFLVHSDLLWVEYCWKRTVYYLFYHTQGLDEVFGVEMLRTYV